MVSRAMTSVSGPDWLAAIWSSSRSGDWTYPWRGRVVGLRGPVLNALDALLDFTMTVIAALARFDKTVV
jgi:hypothetical protein